MEGFACTSLTIEKDIKAKRGGDWPVTKPSVGTAKAAYLARHPSRCDHRPR